MHVARLGRFLENPKIDDTKSRKSRFLSKYSILARHLLRLFVLKILSHISEPIGEWDSVQSAKANVDHFPMDHVWCETGKISGKLGKCQLKFWSNGTLSSLIIFYWQWNKLFFQSSTWLENLAILFHFWSFWGCFEVILVFKGP